MTDATQIRRVELTLALLWLTAASAGVDVTLDAVRFHAASLPEVHAEGIAVLVLAGASTAALGLALCSAMRELAAQRARVRSLRRIGSAIVDGRSIVVVGGSAAIAFCAGLLRPRIFVSRGAMCRLSAAELRAVVAHEAHHADRRDPLRLLIGRALASSLRPIPGVGALGRRHAMLAELAADAAAVRSLGSPAPLAGALLAFDEDEHGSVAGVTPERVDHLLGELPPERVPRALLVVCGLCLGALVSFALLLLTVPEHPEMQVGAAPLCLATVYVVAGPAWLLGRRLRQRPAAAS